jgi:toluene monooxygenase system ferredoxin subunit
MSLERVCAAGEIGEGGMAAFFLDGWEVLVLRDSRGDLHAFDGICPHEDFPLIHGQLDGDLLVCANHLWCFDATTGKGVNPPTCKLTEYALRVDGEDVYVDTATAESAVPNHGGSSDDG